jgi:hypothetical protein
LRKNSKRYKCECCCLCHICFQPHQQTAGATTTPPDRFLCRLVTPILPGVLRFVWNTVLMMVYLPDHIIDFAYACTTQNGRVHPTHPRYTTRCPP